MVFANFVNIPLAKVFLYVLIIISTELIVIILKTT